MQVCDWFAFDSRSQTEVACGHSLSKIREVFGCHSHVYVCDLFFSQIFFCQCPARSRQVRIVVHERVSVIDENICRRSESLCCVFDYAMYVFVGLFSPLFVEGADYAFKIYL